MTDFCVVASHPRLIEYIDSLQRKNAEALSFYPRQVFERESAKGRLFLGLLNGQPCGYIYVGAGGINVRCHQVCIEYDARRKLYGAALVVAMEDYATERKASEITLRCGFDLDANQFWRELGYVCVGTVEGGIRRRRQINIWKKAIHPGLFPLEWSEPAVGKTSAAIWRKHKETGILTQFNRGRRLNQYRAMILAKDTGALRKEKP